MTNQTHIKKQDLKKKRLKDCFKKKTETTQICIILQNPRKIGEIQRTVIVDKGGTKNDEKKKR